MTVIRSEFFLALNQVATERGISLEDVLDSIKAAVLAAYKKDYDVSHVDEKEDEEETLEVRINKDTGEMHIYEDEKDITPPGFGRIAAQTARQVILQNIREAEKKQVIKHYRSQVGTIIKGRVIRFDGRYVYFDIGKTEGILPPEEKIRGDNYNLNDTYAVFIKEIKEDEFGNQRIIVSRAQAELVEELFKKEVPEVSNGTVKIQGVVREPGERTKIAVFSDQTGVDPVGACVGQKGIRVKAVNSELGNEEKIDIIQFNEDDALFVREALSPAKAVSIELDKENKRAIINVEEDQAPLAIGKSGVNVNLASRLTGYEIDIVQVESKGNSKKKSSIKEKGVVKKEKDPKEKSEENNNKKKKEKKSDKEGKKDKSDKKKSAKKEQKNTKPKSSALPKQSIKSDDVDSKQDDEREDKIKEGNDRNGKT